MENYVKFATFNYPDFIPVSISFLPATWIKYGKSLEDIVLAHPVIFPDYIKDQYKNIKINALYTYGHKFDVWGCEWDNISEGYDSICIGHPLKTREDVKNLKIPDDNIGLPHGFMFLQLTYLRGWEECMIDFAEESDELQILINKVLEYNIRQVKIQLAAMKKDDLQITFGDDLGIQNMLPTGPYKWRKYLKPCFYKLYNLCQKAEKLVYMHSDGCIFEIIPDLKDCGVDIINPQFRANGLENLRLATRGEGRNRIAVNLDLDRQMFPFAKPQELKDHILECTESLALREGGLSLSAECAGDVPLENIEAICEGLETARVYLNKKTY